MPVRWLFGSISEIPSFPFKSIPPRAKNTRGDLCDFGNYCVFYSKKSRVLQLPLRLLKRKWWFALKISHFSRTPSTSRLHCTVVSVQQPHDFWGTYWLWSSVRPSLGLGFSVDFGVSVSVSVISGPRPRLRTGKMFEES
jgi:hypothetical protein